MSQQVLDIREDFQEIENNSSWYENVIDSVSFVHENDSKDADSLMRSILDEMAQFYDVVNDREMAQVRAKYSSLREVLRKISTKVLEFDKSRDSIASQLVRLRSASPETFLNGAVDCHLRFSNVNKNKGKEGAFKCQLCEVHDLIEIYEGQPVSYTHLTLQTIHLV